MNDLHLSRVEADVDVEGMETKGDNDSNIEDSESNRGGREFSEDYHSALEEQFDSPQNSIDDMMPSRCLLLELPAEIIDHIVLFLSPLELEILGKTCRRLRKHAFIDLAWQNHVQENVPGVRLKNSQPFETYRELYYSHDPHWFLSKYKIWFSDFFLTGMLVIARYDPRRACIEGYRVVAQRRDPEFLPWEVDDEVIIHTFEPTVRLHMDQPVLQLNARQRSQSLSAGETAAGSFNEEIPMPIHDRRQQGTYSNFLLARPVEERGNMALWPPQLIPASQRVRNSSQEGFHGIGHKPSTRSQVSDKTFRIRRWMQMLAGRTRSNVHLGEEVTTYATLDPKLYTPTAEKPYRGIWVGDYAGHGCEFLLIHQPDDEVPFDVSAIFRKSDETLEDFYARRREERIYRGRIEAIKLTGDPNIPRGEYTFVAEDIGKNGFVRKATEEPFKGARIVNSRGHIAERMFRNDKYIETQLIMISPDKLAQYWVGFGHISFYERVKIDKLLSPYTNNLEIL